MREKSPIFFQQNEKLFPKKSLSIVIHSTLQLCVLKLPASFIFQFSVCQLSCISYNSGIFFYSLQFIILAGVSSSVSQKVSLNHILSFAVLTLKNLAVIVSSKTFLNPVRASPHFYVLVLMLQVKEKIATDEYKPDSALVVLDFLIRHGLVTPDNGEFLLSSSVLLLLLLLQARPPSFCFLQMM